MSTKCHFFSGYLLRTTIAPPDSSTVIAIASPKVLASPVADVETSIRAWMRSSGAVCVVMRSLPWLWSMSRRWPGLTGSVFEKSRL